MSAPDLRVYRGAVQTSPGVWIVTYACGLAFRERKVTARVMRHERVTYIDWVAGEIPDAVVDEPLRFALSADVEAAERAARASTCGNRQETTCAADL